MCKHNVQAKLCYLVLITTILLAGFVGCAPKQTAPAPVSQKEFKTPELSWPNLKDARPGTPVKAWLVNEPIKLGAIDILTGGLAATGIPLRDGTACLVRYINENLGGINGHPIEVISMDGKYDLATEIAAFTKLVNVDRVLAVNMPSTGSVMALAPKSDQYKTVLFGVPEASIIWHPQYKKYVFATWMPYHDIYKIMVKYVVNEWNKANPNIPPKIGMMTMDAPFGVSTSEAVKYMAKQLNVPVVAHTWRKLASLDTSTQVLTLKNAGANIVFVMDGDSGCVSFAKECVRQGYRPKVAGHWILLGAQSTIDAYEGGGEGYIAYIPWATWDDVGNDAVDFSKELMKQYRPDITYEGFYFYRGWADTAVLCEAIRRAVNSVGYSNLTSDVVRDQIITIKNFAIGCGPVQTFSEEDHAGAHATQFYQIQKKADGKYAAVRITDWIPMEPRSAAEMTAEFYSYGQK